MTLCSPHHKSRGDWQERANAEDSCLSESCDSALVRQIEICSIGNVSFNLLCEKVRAHLYRVKYNVQL